MTPTTTAEFTRLRPEQILADDNARFGLKKLRVADLKEKITAAGGVNTPLEVEPLETPIDGKEFRLTAGFYRHEAVSELNSEGGSFDLPVMVQPVGSALERLKRQISENKDRENLSPMDKAIAMTKLIQQGMDKMSLRKEFSTPGGRKGLAMQPASNSFINMTLSFLDLPAAVQTKIHDGRIGVAAAYELMKIFKTKPDKLKDVLDRIEADRVAEIEADEADEQKFLAEEQKAIAAREKETEKEKALEEAKQAHEKAVKDADEAKEAASKAYLATMTKGGKTAKTPEEKKALKEAKEAAEKAAQDAEKAADKAQADLEKAEAKLKADKEKAAQRAKELVAARKGKAKAPAAVSPTAVKKAAQAVGASVTVVPLKAQEIKKILTDMAVPGVFPKVREIVQAFTSCFYGEPAGVQLTDKQLYNALAVITGEKKAKE